MPGPLAGGIPSSAVWTSTSLMTSSQRPTNPGSERCGPALEDTAQPEDPVGSNKARR